MASWFRTENGELVNLDQAAVLRLHGHLLQAVELPQPVELQAIFPGSSAPVIVQSFRGAAAVEEAQEAKAALEDILGARSFGRGESASRKKRSSSKSKKNSR